MLAKHHYAIIKKSSIIENGYFASDTSRGAEAPRVVSGEEQTVEVINFRSKHSRRISYLKDFCSLHIHGLYLYNIQGFIANNNLWRTKKTDSNFWKNCWKKLKKLKIVAEVANPVDKAIYSLLPNVNTTEKNLFVDRTIITICL